MTGNKTPARVKGRAGEERTKKATPVAELSTKTQAGVSQNRELPLAAPIPMVERRTPMTDTTASASASGFVRMSLGYLAKWRVSPNRIMSDKVKMLSRVEILRSHGGDWLLSSGVLKWYDSVKDRYTTTLYLAESNGTFLAELELGPVLERLRSIPPRQAKFDTYSDYWIINERGELVDNSTGTGSRNGDIGPHIDM